VVKLTSEFAFRLMRCGQNTTMVYDGLTKVEVPQTSAQTIVKAPSLETRFSELLGVLSTRFARISHNEIERAVSG